MSKKRLFFNTDNVFVGFQSGLDKVGEQTKMDYKRRPDGVFGIQESQKTEETILTMVQAKPMEKPAIFEGIDLRKMEDEAIHCFFEDANPDVTCKLWMPELGGCTVTLLLDDFINKQRPKGGGSFYLVTEGDVHHYVGLSTLEVISSGIRYEGSFSHQGMGVMALRFHPRYKQDELVIPDDPFEGFKGVWYDSGFNAEIPTHTIPASILGSTFFLNFVVSGEFGLTIFYLADGDTNLQFVFSKSFCCK